VVKKGQRRAAASALGLGAQRLLASATKYSQNPYDRLRIATILILGLLPVWVPRLLFRVARPFLKGLREVVRVFANQRRRPPEEAPKSRTPVHPFRPGDLVFSAGIDWFSTSLTWLRAIRETVDVQVVWLIHDVTPIVVPHFHTGTNERLYTTFFELVSKTCARILYSSKSTQSDGIAVQRHLGLEPANSSVIRLGSRLPRAASDAEADEYLAEIGVTGDFIAFVATIEVRKNHETVYRAYRRLLAQHGDRLPQLVFAGAPGWKTRDFLVTLEQDPVVRGKILVVTPDEIGLDAIYRRCLFTVYPSLYEGWGLPVVESLAYGKFVVASRNSSLPEAGEGWPDYVDDAWDVDAWCRAIERYAFDREALRQKTAAIVERYRIRGWDECARQIADELAAVMGRVARPAAGRATIVQHLDDDPDAGIADDAPVRGERSA
jgi:glycosyltransferase involved in cell wall biosynthesis